MSLRSRGEVRVDTGVQLDVAEPKPGSSSGLQQWRLVDLGKAEKLDVEGTGGIFSSRGDRDLNVVDPFQLIARSTVTTLPINSTPVVKTIGSYAGFSE